MIQNSELIEWLKKKAETVPMPWSRKMYQAAVKALEAQKEMISRKTVNVAICNACGKIDCDKMDKCEKLQLPPVNCSEFPNNSDTISRQAAIDCVMECYDNDELFEVYEDRLNELPPIQPEIVRCKDCKHNPKYEWFGCPMSHLSEKQRPETAWCWKAERRSDERSD